MWGDHKKVRKLSRNANKQDLRIMKTFSLYNEINNIAKGNGSLAAGPFPLGFTYSALLIFRVSSSEIREACSSPMK